MLIDTHTHFYDEWLLPDAEEAVARAVEAGVGKMIQANVDSKERPAMWAIGERHPGVIFQMLGLYPGSVTTENWQDELDQVYSIAATGDWKSKSANYVHNPRTNQVSQEPFGLGQILRDGPSPHNMQQDSLGATLGGPGTNPIFRPGPNRSQATRGGTIVAIGEIGLDYHEGKEYEKEQKEVLRLQLELAAKMDLPVNIHLRDAWEDFFQIIEDCRHLHLRGNLHCFTASYEVYERANRSGRWSVGIGGVVTYKNAGLPKTLERIPLEDILLETDAPYLAPVPKRGQRNESAYLPYIAAKVAEIKGTTPDDIAQITTHNAETLFGI